MSELSLYIHVPFCARKCAYCDFNAYSGLGALADDFVRALLQEIETTEERGRAVSTVFFGGGTPTYLSAEQLGAILEALRRSFCLSEEAEITTEANPATVDAAKFAALRQAGFNRLSIGVQAFDDRLLARVDREHSAEEAAEAVAAARRAGFDNLSLDLMFGLPTQTRADWDASLERALALGPEHLSLYALTIEPGTRFERLHAGGKLPLPAEEDELWMYERAIERLAHAGFVHYEVSNFARPGYCSRHNLTYWHNGEYLGFGPGAVSYLRGRRWTKEKFPPRYVAKVQTGVDLSVESEELEAAGTLAETLMLGLRLRDGISLYTIDRRFGGGVEERFGPVFERLTAAGLLEREGDTLRLTHRGLLFANDVFVEFLP